MKNVVYFHGIHGDTTKSVAPYIANRLKEYNISMMYPTFFDRGYAYYENFEKEARKILEEGLITEETIVIAHSIGNAFSTRFLCENKLKPAVYISLAGWAEKFEVSESIKDETYKAIPDKKYLTYIKENVPKRISVYSNDDKVPYEVLKSFSDDIDSKFIYVPDKLHFGTTSGVQELPELIDIMKDEEII